ncbi:TetR/AcrR family transcriptional regulator [Paenibacillus sepulcri]|uniref:TetR/AcrR family transcriptional regulator n=1 Tax=Paenibacillus sepulcri TaxID=359917 RepID=UPI0035E9864C
MEKKRTAKERILATASELFYREGIRAVGIDRIIEESDVAKASFYRSFSTKDDLIVAYLQERGRLGRERVKEAELLHPDSVKEQLYMLLRQLVERMRQTGFRGCAYMNAVVEFPDEDHPAHRQAVENRLEQWDTIERIATRGGARKPDELAFKMRLMCNGAMSTSYMHKERFRPDVFFEAAKLIIDSHFDERPEQ